MTGGRARAGAGGQRLPAKARITSSDEIRALFRRGKRRKTRHLDVFVAASPVAHSRLGVVVAKPRRGRGEKGGRIAAPAVRRNRLRRRLRELGRTEALPRLEAAGRRMDVLLRARPEAYEARYEVLRNEVREVVARLCSSDT